MKKIFSFKMKFIIFTAFLLVSFPVKSFERSSAVNHQPYDYQEGFAYENKCFRYEYREYYVPGNSKSPGYVRSHNKRISVPCDRNKGITNNYHHKNKPVASYANHKLTPKCTSSTTLGGLIGGGIAASLSKSDAYGWAIPLGAILGAGIGNAECK